MCQGRALLTSPTHRVILLGYKVSATRVCAIILSLGGVALISAFPSPDNAAAADDGGGDAGDGGGGGGGGDEAVGLMFVLVAAICYGLFEVCAERYVFQGRSSTLISNALCGTIGLFTAVVYVGWGWRGGGGGGGLASANHGRRLPWSMTSTAGLVGHHQTPSSSLILATATVLASLAVLTPLPTQPNPPTPGTGCR